MIPLPHHDLAVETPLGLLTVDVALDCQDEEEASSYHASAWLSAGLSRTLVTTARGEDPLFTADAALCSALLILSGGRR